MTIETEVGNLVVQTTALLDTVTNAIQVAAIDTNVQDVVDRKNEALAVDIPEAIASVAAINNRGNWATSTAYTYKDIVFTGSTWYICVVPHTSAAAFGTDSPTKWRVYQGVVAGALAAEDGTTLVGHLGQNLYAYLEDVMIIECADAVEEAAAWANGAKLVLRTDLMAQEARVLHLSMDGSNAGTTFTDISDEGHPITRVGTPVTSTTAPKFGTASLDYSGVGNYLKVADDPSLRILDTWTIECWHKFKTAHMAAEKWSFICSKGTTGSLTDLWYFAIGSTNKIAFSSGNNQATVWVSYPYLDDTTNWHHLSLNCLNNVVTLYVDGVALGSATLGVGANVLMSASQSTGDLLIGGWNYGTANTEGDYIDDFMILNGVCLRKAAFTPPTAPLAEANTVVPKNATFTTVVADVAEIGTVKVTGGQVVFPATQAPSANPHALDDYKEGDVTLTATASFVPGTGTVTLDLANSFLKYTKIGRQCTINAKLVVASVSSPGVNMTLNGLPYDSLANAYSAASIYAFGFEPTMTTQIVGGTGNGSSGLTIQKTDGVGSVAILAPDIKAGTTMYITCTYFTA